MSFNPKAGISHKMSFPILKYFNRSSNNFRQSIENQFLENYEIEIIESLNHKIIAKLKIRAKNYS